VVSVTFKKATSIVSYAAALASFSALPLVADARLWKGNTARVIIGRWYQAAGVGTIAVGNVLAMTHPIPGVLSNAQVFGKSIDKATQGGGPDGSANTNDGFIFWDKANNRLIVGEPIDTGDEDSLRTGLLFAFGSHGPYHFASALPSTVWGSVGAGDADGTSIPATGGVTLLDGQAWGWYSNSAGSVLYNPTAIGELFSYGNTVAGAVPNLIQVQKAVVDSIGLFDCDPGSFIIVRRVGDDLIWWNGQVTRGHTVGQFDDMGSHPTKELIVGDANPDAPAHVETNNALEMALDWRTTGAGSGDFGSGRTLRIHVRKGLQEFVRKLRRYGTMGAITAAALSYNSARNSLILTGEGSPLTQLLFRNPASAGRSAAEIGVFAAVANVVKVKGLTFTQDYSATRKPSYYYFEGNEVTLDGCEFNGPVYVKANKVTVRNCIFTALNTTTRNFVADTAGNPIVAQHLYITTPSDGSISKSFVKVKNNHFTVDQDAGTHASLVLDPYSAAYSLPVEIAHNKWTYAHAAAASYIQPAIHLNKATDGDLSIHHNEFLGARGVDKAGNDTGVGTFPFDGDYSGAPLQRDAADTQMTACAYISGVKGRSSSSSLRIWRNRFDLGSINGSARYVMWAGLGLVFSTTSLGAVTADVYNVEVHHNHFLMNLNGTGNSWTAGVAPQPWTSGVFISPTWQTGNFTRVTVDNVHVHHNKFDLGGLDTNYQYIWRSMSPWLAAMLPAAGTKFVTDVSGCVVVTLKAANAAYGSVIAREGRWAQGVKVNHNTFTQAIPTATNRPYRGVISTDLDSATLDRWSPAVVTLSVTDGHASKDAAGYTIATDVIVNNPSLPTTACSVMWHPQFIGNIVNFPAIKRSGAGVGHSVLVRITGAFAALVSDNTMMGWTDTAAGTSVDAPFRIDGGSAFLSANILHCRESVLGYSVASTPQARIVATNNAVWAGSNSIAAPFPTTADIQVVNDTNIGANINVTS
jgi:hypothetical protein